MDEFFVTKYGLEDQQEEEQPKQYDDGYDATMSAFVASSYGIIPPPSPGSPFPHTPDLYDCSHDSTPYSEPLRNEEENREGEQQHPEEVHGDVLLMTPELNSEAIVSSILRYVYVSIWELLLGNAAFPFPLTERTVLNRLLSYIPETGNVAMPLNFSGESNFWTRNARVSVSLPTLQACRNGKPEESRKRLGIRGFPAWIGNH
eukprot:c10427_g1_i1 orf=199-807(+)